MMMNGTIFYTVTIMVFVALILPASASMDEFCFLCPNGRYPSERFSLAVKSDGTTCEDVDRTMFNPSNFRGGSAACVSQQNLYRRQCCDMSFPFNGVRVFAQEQTEAQNTVQRNPFPQGDQQLCNLCVNKKMPSKPYTITTVMYMDGNPTCQDLYFKGLSGNIPSSLCYPLQIFMRVPCGCNN
jgi:hypothetical protein